MRQVYSSKNSLQRVTLASWAILFKDDVIINFEPFFSIKVPCLFLDLTLGIHSHTAGSSLFTRGVLQHISILGHDSLSVQPPIISHLVSGYTTTYLIMLCLPRIQGEATGKIGQVQGAQDI